MPKFQCPESFVIVYKIVSFFNMALANVLCMCTGILERNPIKRIDTIACEPVGFSQCIFEVKRLIFCCDQICFYLEKSCQALQFLPCWWIPGNWGGDPDWHYHKAFFFFFFWIIHSGDLYACNFNPQIRWGLKEVKVDDIIECRNLSSL